MVLLDALDPGGLLASLSDSRKIFLHGQPIAYEVVELVAAAAYPGAIVKWSTCAVDVLPAAFFALTATL
jgi:hypothetical protein